jgi:hypothetical protein
METDLLKNIGSIREHHKSGKSQVIQGGQISPKKPTQFHDF